MNWIIIPEVAIKYCLCGSTPLRSVKLCTIYDRLNQQIFHIAVQAIVSILDCKCFPVYTHFTLPGFSAFLGFQRLLEPFHSFFLFTLNGDGTLPKVWFVVKWNFCVFKGAGKKKSNKMVNKSTQKHRILLYYPWDN